MSPLLFRELLCYILYSKGSLIIKNYLGNLLTCYLSQKFPIIKFGAPKGLLYMGFRAEVLNTKVDGGTMFKPGATFGNNDTDNVNGYIFNCSDTSGKVTNPSVDTPDYK